MTARRTFLCIFRQSNVLGLVASTRGSGFRTSLSEASKAKFLRRTLRLPEIGVASNDEKRHLRVAFFYGPPSMVPNSFEYGTHWLCPMALIGYVRCRVRCVHAGEPRDHLCAQVMCDLSWCRPAGHFGASNVEHSGPFGIGRDVQQRISIILSHRRMLHRHWLPRGSSGIHVPVAFGRQRTGGG